MGSTIQHARAGELHLRRPTSQVRATPGSSDASRAPGGLRFAMPRRRLCCDLVSVSHCHPRRRLKRLEASHRGVRGLPSSSFWVCEALTVLTVALGLAADFIRACGDATSPATIPKSNASSSSATNVHRSMNSRGGVVHHARLRAERATRRRA